MRETANDTNSHRKNHIYARKLKKKLKNDQLKYRLVLNQDFMLPKKEVYDYFFVHIATLIMNGKSRTNSVNIYERFGRFYANVTATVCAVCTIDSGQQQQ